MKNERAEAALRKYMESASAADRRRLAEALASAPGRADPEPDVPRRLLRIGRGLALLVAGVLVAANAWDLWLPVVVGMIWFPNHMGVVANRYLLASPRHRAFAPWATFITGWLGLFLYCAAAIWL